MNCNAHTCLCTYMVTWGTFPSMHLATDVDCLLILASHGNHCLHLRLQVPKSILVCVDRIFYTMLSICLWVVQHPKSSVNTYTTLGSSHWLSDKKKSKNGIHSNKGPWLFNIFCSFTLLQISMFSGVITQSSIRNLILCTAIGQRNNEFELTF